MYTLFHRVETGHRITIAGIVCRGVCWLMVAAVCSAADVAAAAEGPQSFVGNWALTIPSGGAGWLGVVEKDGQLQASILWGGGSVLPVTSAKVEGDQLVLTRVHALRQKSAAGKTITETITARRSGDTLKLATSRSGADGRKSKPIEFSGKRIPPVGPTPDLSKVKFGQPVKLLNGKDLAGWKLLNPKQTSGWSVCDGVLMNRAPQEKASRTSRTPISARSKSSRIST